MGFQLWKETKVRLKKWFCYKTQNVTFHVSLGKMLQKYQVKKILNKNVFYNTLCSIHPQKIWFWDYKTFTNRTWKGKSAVFWKLLQSLDKYTDKYIGWFKLYNGIFTFLWSRCAHGKFLLIPLHLCKRTSIAMLNV